MKKLAIILSPFVLFAGSSFAGELGVSNSYGNSFRQGSGTSSVHWSTNSQLNEHSINGAIKIETSSYGGNSENDHDDKNSSTPSGFSDQAFSAAFGYGTRDYSETTKASGSSKDTYSFGSTNFTHSVSTFSR